MKRSAGILMHISSLPSPYGIGTMGKAAYDFADFLFRTRQHYWQILPIGPTSYGDSPYQSISTHAGNPYYIDLDLLVKDGLLLQSEIDAVDWSWSEKRVDFGLQFYYRFPLLRKAFARGAGRDAEKIEAFRRENGWVDNYALYMACKAANGMKSWSEWPEELRMREPEALERAASELREDIAFYTYLQVLFFEQWNALRSYIHGLGIELIGDLPIYVPYDSCDVWAEPDLFQLDEVRVPTSVAGVPPDYFTADGQLWGNPLYNWERMEEDDFAWWQDRITAASRMFDVIRIDHFRGLESYWSVAYGSKTARVGKWVKGPGYAFIDCLKRNFPRLNLIAEDLGVLTDAVIELQKASGYPGMKVLEFAFDACEPGDYLPHRYERNCICYTGTHDNDTMAAWLANADEKVVAYARKYLGIGPGEGFIRAAIRAGMASVADTFIVQLQDWLELDTGARMNLPGTLSTANWTWRLPRGLLTPALEAEIAELTLLYER